MVTFTRPVIAIVILFSPEALETVIVPKLEAVPLGLKIGFLLDSIVTPANSSRIERVSTGSPGSALPLLLMSFKIS